MISKKELQEAIDQAIIDIIESVSKVAATKDDLKNLATKDDLNNLDMKLSNVETKLSNEIKDIKRHINDLKADTPTPQEFKDHEKRIKSLESAVFPS